MNAIEAGRGTVGYIGKTAGEISGIGRGTRVFKAHRKIYEGGIGESLLNGVFYGLTKVVIPLASKSSEEGKWSRIGLVVDLAANALALNFYLGGNVPAAFIAKFGYNLLAQIAPDVAKLAKDRAIRRAK